MMKKNENKINRRRTNLGLLVVSLMLAATLVACQKPVEDNPTPSNSEVVSEVVSEPISEEVSEPVSEEVSEVVSEEAVEEIEYTNFSNIDELMNYLEELNKTTIVWFNFSEGTEQAIIPNGGKYTLEGDNVLITVISTNNNIVDIKRNVNYIHARCVRNQWGIYLDTTGTDLEVSFTVVYEDGTEEDFTIYITKE